MTTDSTKTKLEKLDYFCILKRRKRTVGSFLTEHNIVSVLQAEGFLNALEKEFVISEEFKAAVLSEVLSHAPKPTENSVEEGVKDTHEDTQEPFHEDVEQGVLEDVEVVVQKPKKRSKKETV